MVYQKSQSTKTQFPASFWRIFSVYYDPDLVFVVVAIVSNAYENTAFTKAISEIW